MSATLDLVAAVAANGVIGRAGGLPWRLPDDLKHFKSVTMGRPVVMGRRTFEEIKKPLPGRRNIVVSRTWSGAEGFEVARSLDEAVAMAGDGRVCVIGGGVMYAAALPIAHTMHLTELDDAVDGDAHFPRWDKSQWRVTSEIRHEADDRHAMGFWFRTYERI